MHELTFRQNVQVFQVMYNCCWLKAVLLNITESTFGRLIWTIKYAYCERRGHDWEDNGYANPDSGAIIMDCKRCDYSVHIPLY